VRPLAEDRTQRGFWARSNKAFRRLETKTELTALAINEDDIAGHCLTFQLSTDIVGTRINAQKRSKNAPKRPKTPQNAPKRPKNAPKRPKNASYLAFVFSVQYFHSLIM
jgi:hypothetical protein